MSAAASDQAVLIVGATSGIGRAVARRWGEAGHHLVLAARNLEEARAQASDVALRSGVRATPLQFDAMAIETHAGLFDRAAEVFAGGLAGIILCQGRMAPQSLAVSDVGEARAMIDVNFTSAVSLLNRAADYFEKLGRGTIIAVTSVAGDRGRQSNYVYGSTKAALQTYLQGLRHRLAGSGVRVLDVRPGFVDTGMTWGLQGVKRAASPQRVADEMYRARRRSGVLYTPWFWRWIMLIVRSMPAALFHRLGKRL